MLCHHSQSDTSKLEKADELQSDGAAGCILVVDGGTSVATAYLDFPVTEVTSAAATAIHKYIASAR